MFQDSSFKVYVSRHMVFQRKFFVALILVLGVMVFFTVAGRNGAVLAVESKFFSFIGVLGKPVFSFATKVSDIRQGILHYREIMDENHNLRDQYLGALEQLASLSETEKENVSLREAIALKNELARGIIPAYTAGLFRDVSEEVIIVDKGTEDGVTSGNVVVGKNHALIGRVVEVYDKTAKVLLATSPSEKIDVVFAGAPLRVVAEGAGAGEFTLGLVPADVIIANGDIVLVSHANPVYPSGFIVGTVSRIQDSGSKVFRDVWVRSPFDPFQEETVYIVR